MNRLALILIALFFTGCVGLLPKISETHPTGYSQLVQIIPACQTSDLDNYGACLSSAEMLEKSTSQGATSRFIAHWEETAFGLSDRKQKAGEARFNPGDSAMESGVWASVKAKNIRAMMAISVPVLKHIYTIKQSDYNNKMLQVLDLIEPNSQSSLNTFREAHSKLILQ